MECTSTTASVQVIAAKTWATVASQVATGGPGTSPWRAAEGWASTQTHTRTQIEESYNKPPKDLKTFLWVWSHQSHIPLLMNHHHCRKRQKGQNIWDTRFFFFLIYSFSPEKSSCFKQQSLDKNHWIKLYFNSSFKAGIINSHSWPIHLQACKFEFE